MSVPSGRRGRSLGLASAQRGFTLVEVMIAVLILGFGLLGLALLQTMNVRFVQSSNFRTQATNLSYELLDQVRANRISRSSYAGTFTALTSDADCMSPTGTNLTPDAFTKDWRCRMGKALGADAEAEVTLNGDVVEVVVSWADERWDVDGESGKVTVRTQL